MSIEGQKFKPADAATPEQTAFLAIEYHRAAEILLKAGRRGEPLSLAPYRLIALHAVELYLNAFLVSVGHSPTALKCNHHLGSRARASVDAGLKLRQGTIEHLHKVMETREYVTSRYKPGAHGTSHLNRLAATLQDVASKVTRAIDRSNGE